MSVFTRGDKTVVAEQFNESVLPWPTGIEQEQSMGGGMIYTINTPSGERLVEDGDFIITDGDGDTPDVVPYEEFIEEYMPIPEG